MHRKVSGSRSRLTCLMAGVAVAAVTSWSGAAVAGTVKLSLLKTYTTGIFDGSAAEIAGFDSASNRIFVTNSANGTLDVFDLLGAAVLRLREEDHLKVMLINATGRYFSSGIDQKEVNV